MKHYSLLKVTFVIYCSFIDFNSFLTNFGSNGRFWKNQEIQDEGSKMVAI